MRAAGAAQKLADPPGPLPIAALALALAVVTALVRTWCPIDRWLYLLGFFRVAFADVPRDLCLFVVGMVAYRQQWVIRFPTRAGLAWLGVGLSLAAFWYAYDLWLADAQYATYIVHAFPVLAFQALLVGLSAPSLLKFLPVALAAIPVSYLQGGLLKKPLRLLGPCSLLAERSP